MIKPFIKQSIKEFLFKYHALKQKNIIRNC